MSGQRLSERRRLAEATRLIRADTGHSPLERVVGNPVQSGRLVACTFTVSNVAIARLRPKSDAHVFGMVSGSDQS
jgi:hypothetical protein